VKRWTRFLWAIGYIQGTNPPPRWPPWERFLKRIGWIRVFHEVDPAPPKRVDP
jgi:hypothetical protein